MKLPDYIILVCAIAIGATAIAQDQPGGVRARRAMRRLGVHSVQELAAKFTVYELSRDRNVDFETRKELTAMVKSAGLGFREEVAAAPVVDNIALSAGAKALLGHLGVRDFEQLAVRYTARDLLRDDIKAALNGYRRELLVAAQRAGRPLRSGAESRGLACDVATKNLPRNARAVLNKISIGEASVLAREHSLESLLDLDRLAHRTAFGLLDWAEACGHPISVTEAERVKNCAPELLDPSHREASLDQ